MQAPHHRKVELQSTADLAYLHRNTVALAREKLDLHFPPSANASSSDPMKERVRELVDDFITTTFTTAIPSISINGLDTDSTSGTADAATLKSLLSTREAVEYEAYDAGLAARVAALYAQLEALTTTVAQMRRDAPARAARAYADALSKVVEEEEDEDELDVQKVEEEDDDAEGGRDVLQRHPEWKLQMPFSTEQERERWREGEMAEVYADALRTLVRLQPELGGGVEDEESAGDGEDGDESLGLAATVGKVERARKAAEVVEKM